MPGIGPAAPEVMVLAQSPGQNEDEQGTPLVGASGVLADSYLDVLGLKSEDVYLTNIVKCRPLKKGGGNRDPHAVEIKACWPHFEREIELVNPRLILCMGKIAFETLFTDQSFASGLGHKLTWRRWPVFTTYHPSHLLRPDGAAARIDVVGHLKRVRAILDTVRATV